MLYPYSLQKLKTQKESGEWGPRKRAWPCFRLWVRGVGRKRRRVGGSSEPGLACSPRLFQTVTATQAVSGDLPEDGEHGVPDSVRQSWDIIRCQPFCGHWGQHPHLTSSWGGMRNSIMAGTPGSRPTL